MKKYKTKEAGEAARRAKTIERNKAGRGSQESFLSRANERHGDKYDYSKAEYVGLRYKVTIGCPDHGWFEQMAQAHIINGQGCPECARLARFGPRGPYGPRGPRGPYGPRGPSSVACFDKKALLALLDHEQRLLYEYDSVPEGIVLGDIRVACGKHGLFTIKATRHVHPNTRAGCPECGKERRAASNANRAQEALMTSAEFKNRAKLIHGGRYDYSAVEYRGNARSVKIICSAHGVFEQTPREHFSGSGCQKCANYATSLAENQWLDSLGVTVRQKRIRLKTGKWVKVDGFDPDTHTVYEFLGDYWHGNPTKYPSGHNTRCRKSFAQLYCDTQDRLKLIEAEGYKVHVIWESEWNDGNQLRSRKSIGGYTASSHTGV